MGQIQCSCDGSAIDLATGSTFAHLRPVVPNLNRIRTSEKKTIIMSCEGESENEPISKIDIKNLSTNHVILEHTCDQTIKANKVLVNKETIPEDINSFKQSCQTILNSTIDESITKGEEIQGQDQLGEVSKKDPILLSPQPGMTSPSQPIKIVKKLKYKQLGTSKRMLTRKLIDMGVIRIKPKQKSFWFF